jgi:hypothetical protein
MGARIVALSSFRPNQGVFAGGLPSQPGSSRETRLRAAQRMQHRSVATRTHLAHRIQPSTPSTMSAKTFSDPAATSYGSDGARLQPRRNRAQIGPVTASTNPHRIRGLACGAARGASLRCPDPEALNALSVDESSQFLVPAEGARNRGNHCDGKQPAQNVEPGRHCERCPLGIKVAGLTERGRGDQHIEGVQCGVESRVRTWADGYGMASAKD